MEDKPNHTSKVAIIVINYRTSMLLIDCLNKMQSTFENDYVTLVIVDNNSGDDSIEDISNWARLQDYSDRISIISSGFNGGFSYGNNLGIRSIDAEYYLLLNSDAYLIEDCLDILISHIESDDSTGIVSPKLIWPDGRPQESTFRYHHPISELINQAKTSYVSKLFNKHIVAQPVQTKIVNVDWTSFACVLIKKELINDIDLLDEGFFMYFEDVDYCFRANNANWIIKHIPHAKAVHLRGGSSNVKSNTAAKRKLPKYYYQSRTRIFYKCYGRLGLLFANIMWIIGRCIAILRLLTGNTAMRGIRGQALGIWSNFLNPIGKYTHPSGDENNA